MLLEAAPIQGKSKLIEQVQQNAAASAEAAQRQQQIQQQLLEGQKQAQQAKAISDISLSKERFTRALSNLGLQEERASQAVENRAQSALERTRAIKELSTLDDDRLMKYLEIVQIMESMNKMQETSDKSEDLAIATQSEKLNAAFPQAQ
jgi:hypothetical protein